MNLPFICRFSTSRQTLTQLPDTFFTALLSGRISTLRDDNGDIFIDRDPQLFSIILNYLRTREIDIGRCKISVLLHEAEFYNIAPLIKRLMLCEDLSYSSNSCGDILFYGYLTPPHVPVQDSTQVTNNARQVPETIQNAAVAVAEDEDTISQRTMAASSSILDRARPGQMVRVPENGNRTGQGGQSQGQVGGVASGNGHSRNSSWDLRVGPSRAWSMRHSRNSSADLNKFVRNDIAQVLGQTAGQNPVWHDPLRVQIIKAHHNWICVSYAHFLTCYRLKDSVGWQVRVWFCFLTINVIYDGYCD